jgi:hypothetical protein
MRKLIDYKISWTIDIDGKQSGLVRFYEGEISDIEAEEEGKSKIVKGYKRTALLKQERFEILGNHLSGLKEALKEFKTHDPIQEQII